MTIDDDIKNLEQAATSGDVCGSYADSINRVLAELARLRAGLPLTADGATVMHGMTVWYVRDDRVCRYVITGLCGDTVYFLGGFSSIWDWKKAYSTEAAARAAALDAGRGE